MSTRLFISYAHRDGGDLAKHLQRDLQTREFEVWLDKRRLQAGDAWAKDIETAIDQCDGKRAVSASFDKALKVWDLDGGQCIATFHCDAPARCCAFADNHRIVAGDDAGRIYILSLEENFPPPSH